LRRRELECQQQIVSEFAACCIDHRDPAASEFTGESALCGDVAGGMGSGLGRRSDSSRCAAGVGGDGTGAGVLWDERQAQKWSPAPCPKRGGSVGLGA
jgi:hypothetical protein